jgi:hypothetical protein
MCFSHTGNRIKVLDNLIDYIVTGTERERGEESENNGEGERK